MYKLVNKIQIGHSELLKLGKKLILRKTLIFIIFGLLFLDFRFYIDYDVIWVKIVHKHKPIYANYWFQWQKKYNIAKKNYEIVLHPMHGESVLPQGRSSSTISTFLPVGKIQHC